MATLIVAIGAQNAFVLRQGLQREHVFVAATLCFVCDVVLVVSGVLWFSALIHLHPLLNQFLLMGGAVFLFVYALRSFRRARDPQALEWTAKSNGTQRSVIMTAFAVSLLNPHAILDTLVIVGGMVSQYHGVHRLSALSGALTMSGLWFYGLGFGAQKLAPFLQRPAVWRAIDGAIGTIMLGLAGNFIWQAVSTL